MSDYGKNFGSSRKTPQSHPIPGSDQIANSAGGFVWAIPDETLLDRFLVLGTEGGSFYANEKDMTYEVGDAVRRLIREKGPWIVGRTVEISVAGRAPKNDPAIIVLAACIVEGDGPTRAAAYGAVNQVCRIGTHIFQLAGFLQDMKGGSAGWGRGLRHAIAGWYNSKPIEDLAYQLVKYQNREGWTHADLLQQAHVLPVDNAHDAAYARVRESRNESRGKARGEDPEFVDPATRRYRHGIAGSAAELPAIFNAHDRMLAATSKQEVIDILGDQPNFPFEAIPTQWLKEVSVWEALAANLPMTATFRNLGRMTASGALAMGNEVSKVLTARMGDGEAIRKSRLHPIDVLKALLTYKSGRGVRGDLTWKPVPKVIDALDGAFYLAFGNVVPTGKNLLLSIDVSGSMNGGVVAGVPGLTPRIGAAAMTLVTQRVEPNAEIVAFSDGTAKRPLGGVVGQTRWDTGVMGRDYRPMLDPIEITSRQRLDDVVRTMQEIPMGGTDCALPMRAALAAKMKVDVFVLLTDDETWYGDVHPSQALELYRQGMGIDSKMVIVSMVANKFSIADPKDPRQLDIVGMDTATPNIISEFARM